MYVFISIIHGIMSVRRQNDVNYNLQNRRNYIVSCVSPIESNLSCANPSLGTREIDIFVDIILHIPASKHSFHAPTTCDCFEAVRARSRKLYEGRIGRFLVVRTTTMTPRSALTLLRSPLFPPPLFLSISYSLSRAVLFSLAPSTIGGVFIQLARSSSISSLYLAATDMLIASTSRHYSRN